MDQHASLTRSIFLNVGILTGFHSLVFVLIAAIYRVDYSYVLWFFAAEAGINTLLVFVLLKSRHDFRKVDSGEQLERVNLANQMTMFRITSLPSLLLLLITSRSYPVAVYLIVYTVLAFITDLLDGYISRKLRETTYVGRYLDSMSDYAVLLAVSIAFVQFGLIPLWFFIAVIVRFVLQWIGMIVVYLVRNGSMQPTTSWLGKASVFGTMVVFGLDLLRLFPWFDPIRPYMTWVEIAATVLLCISLIEKIVLWIREFKAALVYRRLKESPGELPD